MINDQSVNSSEVVMFEMNIFLQSAVFANSSLPAFA
jgi:hypothetical protein